MWLAGRSKSKAHLRQRSIVRASKMTCRSAVVKERFVRYVRILSARGGGVGVVSTVAKR